MVMKDRGDMLLDFNETNSEIQLAHPDSLR